MIDYTVGFSYGGVLNYTLESYNALVGAQLLYKFTRFNTSPTGIRTVDNLGSFGSSTDGLMNSGDWCALNTTDQSISISTSNYITYNKYNNTDNTIVSLITPDSIYILDEQFQYCITTDVEVTQSDLDLMNLEPELIYRLQDTDLNTGLSFLKANIITFIDGRGGNQFLPELVLGGTIEIDLWTQSVQDDLSLTQYGAQSLLLNEDSSGRFLSMVQDGTIVVNTTGQNVDTQFIPIDTLSTLSINSVISGELENLDSLGIGLGTYTQREEDRLLTHEDNNLLVHYDFKMIYRGEV